jgi:hypothetical protein
MKGVVLNRLCDQRSTVIGWNFDYKRENRARNQRRAGGSWRAASNIDSLVRLYVGRDVFV